MWVGEAEKNIAKAFEEAEKNESILFLDEADSFFQSREGAQKQWEITQVNEILIRMEKFKGILICSTNFLKNFDKAALRRFQFKVLFDYLNEKGKKLLFEGFFPDLQFEIVSERLLKLQSLTPGDFKNAAWKLSYSDSFNEEDVLKELEEEVGYKDKKRSLGL